MYKIPSFLKKSDHGGSKGAISFAMAVVLSCLICLCDSPFKTRDSQTPMKTLLNWTPASRPQDLLRNFQNSINSTNIAYYLRCLHKDFLFMADENEVSPINPDSWKYENWNYQVEQEVMTKLFEVFKDSLREDNQMIEFTLTKTDVSDIENPRDSVLLYRDYEMTIYHSYPIYPNYCAGTAELVLKEDGSGLWSLYKFRDIRKDTVDFGELKGLFRY